MKKKSVLQWINEYENKNLWLDENKYKNLCFNENKDKNSDSMKMKTKFSYYNPYITFWVLVQSDNRVV